jgi:signal transduction histidine kinase
MSSFKPDTDALRQNVEKQKSLCSVLHAVGFVVANFRLYGANHAVTGNSMLEARSLLHTHFQQFGNIEILIKPEAFFVDAEQLDIRTSPSNILRARLQELKVEHLEIISELTDTELENFFILLAGTNTESSASDSSSPDKIFSDAGITNIKSEKFTYQRLTSKEMVVAKTADTIQVDVATEIANQIHDAVTGEKKGEGEKSDTPHFDGKNVTSLVSEACNNLMQDPSNQTQKGRQSTRRMLQQVQKKLESMLEGQGNNELTAAVCTAIDELIEDLEIDGAVAGFIRQKNSYETFEKRILRQIKRALVNEAALAEIREKVIAAGMSEETWQELLFLAKPEKTLHEQQLKNAKERADRLTKLLANVSSVLNSALSPAIASTGQEGTETASTINETRSGLTEAFVHAEARINSLNEMLAPDEKNDKDEAAKSFTKRQICELLAEICQELRQPLTVINGTLEMMAAKFNASQDGAHFEPLVTLSIESCERVDELVAKIIDIAGFPDELNPDAHLLKEIYSRS